MSNSTLKNGGPPVPGQKVASPPRSLDAVPMAAPMRADTPAPAHGVRRHYKCVVCGASMRLKRRESHPTRGAAYELQTYDCPGCGNRLQVNEPTPGAV